MFHFKLLSRQSPQKNSIDHCLPLVTRRQMMQKKGCADFFCTCRQRCKQIARVRPVCDITRKCKTIFWLWHNNIKNTLPHWRNRDDNVIHLTDKRSSGSQIDRHAPVSSAIGYQMTRPPYIQWRWWNDATLRDSEWMMRWNGVRGRLASPTPHCNGWFGVGVGRVLRKLIFNCPTCTLAAKIHGVEKGKKGERRVRMLSVLCPGEFFPIAHCEDW